jgi:hypothetical protein
MKNVHGRISLPERVKISPGTLHVTVLGERLAEALNDGIEGFCAPNEDVHTVPKHRAKSELPFLSKEGTEATGASFLLYTFLRPAENTEVRPR